MTGTREELTSEQKRLAEEILDQFRGLGYGYLHHGDCVGADAYVAELGMKYGYHVISHPPSNDTLRAFHESTEILSALPYAKRNQAIVDASDYMLAFPAVEQAPWGGGTGQTIGKALYAGVPLVVITPAGEKRIYKA